MRILKQVLEAERGIQRLTLTTGMAYKILDAQFQGDQLVLWYSSLGESKGEVDINILYTGEEFPFPLGDHISTVQSPDGLVLHIFKVGE